MSKKKSLRYLDMDPYQLTGVRAFFEESKALSQIRSISALWQEQTEGVRAALSAINSANAFNQQLSGITSALSSYQAAMDSLRFPTEGIRTILSSYQNSVAALGYPSMDAHSAVSAIQSHIDIFQNSVGKIHNIYSPITEYSKHLDGIFDKSFASLLKTQSSITDVISGMDLSAFSILSEALPNSIFEQEWFENLTVNDISEIYENEDFAEDVAEELREIIEKKDFSVDKNWSAEKKAKWYTALRYLCVIIMFLASPVVDYTTDKALNTFGITEFWNETGIYEYIDAFFDSFNKETVTEEEAKKTVDTTKTGNISKQKREDLLAKIKEIRTFISAAPQDENTGNLLSYLSELEKDVNGKKYGLVFEEHREEIDEVLDTHTPILTEDEELFIDNGGQMNFLIEGDNLASLKLLQKTHKNSIDLIYIDPPYNTGNNDFIYDDCYVDTEDGFKHSKWISFMSKRLEIARSLLTEKGVIFIQISDIELAQLRLMCDSVFGEENFLNIISVNMKNIAGASGGGEDKRFKKNCEYILVYAKNYSLMPLFNGSYEYREIYSVVEQYRNEGKNWHYTSVLVEKGDKEYIGSTVDGNGDEIKVYKRVNAIVKSVRQVMQDEGISEKDVYYKYGDRIFEAKDAQSSIRTRVKDAKKKYHIVDDIVSIEYVPKTGKNKGTLYEQFYKGDKCRLFAWLKDISEEIDGTLYKKDLQGTFWDYTSRINNLTKEGNVEFGNGKKPVDLLKRIISLYPSSNISILDFFAGSGSTGHAVIAQNLEDDGNRQFILCTNNQNDICREKTYKRLSNVINGYTNGNGKVFKAMPASLKYYKVDYIPVSERMYYEYADELLRHIRELVELENGVNFTNNAEIAIVLTDEELEDFIANIDDFSKCKKLYMGHDLLPDEEQEQAISSHEIEVNIIPDYYYRDLQEG